MRRGYEPGDVVDDAYEIVERIGEGGFGEVYRVRQLSMDRDVAMKILLEPSDEEFAGRFRREVHAVRNLSHPNTVQIYDFAEVDSGHLYYTMEYLEGQTLVEKVQESGAFGLVETRDILVQVLKSLGEAHSRGIVHRDLKPGNVMLAEVYGEKNFVKVLDFGIAKAADSVPTSEIPDETLTSSEHLVGTLRYMAPEQATEDPVGAHSDLFMVGIVAREMITAEKLYAGASEVRLLKKRLDDSPVELPDHIDGHPLGDVLARALEKDHTDRYQSADEMREALEEIPVDVLEEAELPEVEPITPISDLESGDVVMEEPFGAGDETVDDIAEPDELGRGDSRPAHSTRPPPGSGESERNDSPTTGQLSAHLPSPSDLAASEERRETVEQKAVPNPADLAAVDPDGDTIEQNDVPAMVADAVPGDVEAEDLLERPPAHPESEAESDRSDDGEAAAEASGERASADASEEVAAAESQTSGAGADASDEQEEDGLPDELNPYRQQSADAEGGLIAGKQTSWMVGGGAALVLGLVAWLGFFGGGEAADEESGGTEEEKKAGGTMVFDGDAGTADTGSEATAVTTVTVESPQSGVEGRVEGEQVGTTPFEVEVEGETTVELEYDGVSKKIALSPDSPSVRRVVFETDAGAEEEAGDAGADTAADERKAEAKPDPESSDEPEGDGAKGRTGGATAREGTREVESHVGRGRTGGVAGGSAGHEEEDEPDDSGESGESTKVPIFE